MTDASGKPYTGASNGSMASMNTTSTTLGSTNGSTVGSSIGTARLVYHLCTQNRTVLN